MDQNGRPTHEQFRRRMAALRTLSTASGRALAAAKDEALQAFGSEEALLLAVHQRWQVHLLARLDGVLELGARDPHREVLRAVEELGRTMPGLAALLGEHADDPVLAQARRRLARYVDQACSCGRPHPLVASPPPRRATSRRATSRCALRRARAVAARCRSRLAAATAAHPCGTLRASPG